MEKKLEITARLEELGDLDRRIAILNLPTANLCEKRRERILVNGKLQQSCLGCVTQGLTGGKRLSLDEIKELIDFFAIEYGTKFITINGRGDPFHPLLKKETLEKIKYAFARWGIQSYVFTAGQNLDEETCRFLAENETNAMISLFGNRFIDAEFFEGKDYPTSERPLQDKKEIAGNIRRLIKAYKSSQLNGITRIGMNYVVSEEDLEDENRLLQLKDACDRNDIFLICNTQFDRNSDSTMQLRLEQLARRHSSFGLRHSTTVNDQCQMGAGSSATIDFDGMLLRCPYMPNKEGDGLVGKLTIQERKKILQQYIADRTYPCVMRKHQV